MNTVDIDLKSRQTLKEALRHLLSGQISNFTFDKRTFSWSRDRAVRQIGRAVWGLYDDLREHRLTGRDAPSARDKALATRCVLFLQTELDWEWPVPTWRESATVFLIDLVTLGMLRSRRQRRYETLGDFTVWPFIRRADYEAALRDPRLLAGVAAPTVSKGVSNGFKT